MKIMGLFNFLKSSEVKGNVNVVENKNMNHNFNLDIHITGQGLHKVDIMLLVKDLMDDGHFFDNKFSFRLPCKLEPEPTNEHDANAIKVMAKCPNNRTAEWRQIGYVPRDEQEDAKKGNSLVERKEYYWNLYIRFDIINGTDMELSLRKSKFSK